MGRYTGRLIGERRASGRSRLTWSAAAGIAIVVLSLYLITKAREKARWNIGEGSMTTIKIDNAAMARVLAKFKTIENVSTAIAPELEDIQETLFKAAREVPRKAQGAFSRLATPGQRRAYWAKVRSGEARHGPNGYIRSYKLWRAWEKTPMRITPTRIQIGVINEAENNQYVIGSRRQSFHIETGWKTGKMLADDNRKVVVTKVNGAIHRVLNK